MNNKIKTENFWILIIWSVVFMLILSWDQEKIVVLNLVLFCYFLRFLVGDSIETTLGQRREVLLSSLLIDLNTQITLLTNLIVESKELVVVYRTLILALIKKTLTNTNNVLLHAAAVNSKMDLKFDFTAVQLALQAAHDETLLNQLEQNIFVSSQIILDVFPTFTQAADSE